MHSPHHPEPQYTISPPVISSAALAVLGTFAIVHALDLLGYPASRWLSKMASELSPRQILRLLPAPPSPKSDADADSSPTSMARATGLLSKGFRSVTGALATTYKQVPAGLGNWDNSCYQNSVIQGLASLPSLGNFLSQASSAYRTLGEDSTSFALADLLQKLNDPENHGRQFWIRGKLKTMSTIQQQDAQEYYSMVLDALDKEITEASKSQRRASLKLDASVVDEPSQDTQEASETESDSEQCKEIVETKEPCTEEHPILSPNPLDGLLAQRVSCTQCGYSEGLSLIPFNCLTVPLGKGWAYDIRDCLDDFTHLEYIEGVECGKCTVLKTVRTLSALTFPPDSVLAGRLRAAEEILEENNFDDKNIIQKTKILKKNWVKVKKSRQAVVARAPKSLIIHVNRSVFDEMTGDMYKNNARVQYPRILDLAAWCLGSRPSETQKPDHEVEETWSKNPNKSMIERKHTADSSTPSPFQYALKAAVTHWGSHGNGHYVCYRQHAFKVRDPEAQEEGREVPDGSDEPQWWRLSDESVNEVSEEEALHQSNAYMLFYERLDPQEEDPKLTHELEAVEKAQTMVDAETSNDLAKTAQDEPIEHSSNVAADADNAMQVDGSQNAVAQPPFPVDKPSTPLVAYPLTPPDTPTPTPTLTPPPSFARASDVSTIGSESMDTSETPDSVSEADTQMTSDDEGDTRESEKLKEKKDERRPSPLAAIGAMRTATDIGTEGLSESLPVVGAV